MTEDDSVIPVDYKNRDTASAVTEWLLWLECWTISTPVPVATIKRK